MNDPQNAMLPDEIVCTTKRDAYFRSFIYAVGLLGIALWCFLDGQGMKEPQAWDSKHINEVAAYALNRYGPFLFVPAGLLFGALGLAVMRRRFTADAAGLGYMGKTKVPWADITRLDASLLASKQILIVEHTNGKLKLDGYDLHDFKQLVAFVESHAPAESKQTT